MDAIVVSDLRKNYGDVAAVKGISFNVPEGSFFAFLGPNGAGKSTTISVICSLLPYEGGTVSIFGKDPVESRREMGVVFQNNMLDNLLTVRDNVSIRGSMYGLKGKELEERVESALRRSDALDFADRKYSDLSGGQRRRADIARALVHDPKILFLDEPTAGLDPQTRKHMWNTVHDLKESGMTVFLTTHYMEEAADADDVVIIDKGEIVAQGTPAMLRERYCRDHLSVVPKDMDAAERVLKELNVQYERKVDSLYVALDRTVDSIPIIESLKGIIESMEVRTGTLDEAFINITGDDIQ